MCVCFSFCLSLFRILNTTYGMSLLAPSSSTASSKVVAATAQPAAPSAATNGELDEETLRKNREAFFAARGKKKDVVTYVHVADLIITVAAVLAFAKLFP